MIWLSWLLLAILIWLLNRWYKKEAKRYEGYTYEPKEDYIDKNGYERNGYNNKLTHRKVAYRQLYDYPKKHKLKFRYYEVHHIDRNKLNNSKDNLKILTREDHKKEHGII